MARKNFFSVFVVLFVMLASSSAFALNQFEEICRSGTPKQIQAAIDRGAIVTEFVFLLALYDNKNPESLAVIIEAGKEYDLDLANDGAGDDTSVLIQILDSGGYTKEQFRDGRIVEFVKVLLDGGADPNKAVHLKRGGVPDRYLTTPLRAAMNEITGHRIWGGGAAMYGVEMIRMLMDAGARPIADDIARAKEIKDKQTRDTILRMFNVSPSEEESQASEVPSNFKVNGSITGNKVNVRKSPSLSGKVIKQLNAGHPIYISQQKGDWYLVQTASGTKGWVFGDYVRHEGESSQRKKEDNGKIELVYF